MRAKTLKLAGQLVEHRSAVLVAHQPAAPGEFYVVGLEALIGSARRAGVASTLAGHLAGRRPRLSGGGISSPGRMATRNSATSTSSTAAKRSSRSMLGLKLSFSMPLIEVRSTFGVEGERLLRHLPGRPDPLQVPRDPRPPPTSGQASNLTCTLDHRIYPT